jgi:hypothetical protein
LSTEMEKLLRLTGRYLDEDVSIAEMEKGYLRQALAICLEVLKFVIQIKLDQKRDVRPTQAEGETIRSKGDRERKYLSLFGRLEFSRPSYWSDQRGMLYVLDDALSFPSVYWSYNLQELAAEGASQENFRESVKVLEALLDLGLSGTASERNLSRLGQMVDEYYEEKQVPAPDGPVCFCASFDGKGVPKIKPKDKGSPKHMGRLGKGEKRGVKQMATVSVTSWFEPKKRDKKMIINGLMGLAPHETGKKQSPNDNRWHQGIHRRAFLADQERAVAYGIAQINAMMRHPQSRFVVPVDAGNGLEDKIIKYVHQYGLEGRFDGIILDIVHVSEYVWDCANAVLGEQSKLRTGWVAEMLEDLLDSKTQKVIDDLQKIIDKGDLSKTKKEGVQKAITYFTNHRHKMDYKVYLDKGYPVSSALVESNCKHLVKDRMELSGMRWSSLGAQNMMDVRAVKLNGDLPDFISFVRRKDRRPCLQKAA